MNEPGNQIGDAGAAALVEGLKEMKSMEKLDLAGEFLMVGVARSLGVVRWSRWECGLGCRGWS